MVEWQKKNFFVDKFVFWRRNKLLWPFTGSLFLQYNIEKNLKCWLLKKDILHKVMFKYLSNFYKNDLLLPSHYIPLLS